MDNEHLHSLAAKINALDLTDEEQGALVGLITGHGEEREVEAFGMGRAPVILGVEIDVTASAQGSGGHHEYREHVQFCYQKVTWT